MKRHGVAARETIDLAVARLSLPEGSRLLLGVSGGADSVALLRSFSRVAPGKRWELSVIHVNHGLRGERSDADEAFVRTLAASLGLPLRVAAVPTAAYAREHHLSEETAARQVRYAALRAALDGWPGDAIVLAHTRDDQAETLLLHLLRGAGLNGLGGMKHARDSLVRPLLGIGRETILQALQEDRQGYRIDESNLDERHARVRLRRSVIPALKAIQPQPVEVLARAASLLQDDADLMKSETYAVRASLRIENAAGGVAVSRAALTALHASLRRSLLRSIVGDVRGDIIDVTGPHIESIDLMVQAGPNAQGHVRTLPDGIVVRWEGDTLSILPASPSVAEPPLQIPVTVPGITTLPTGVLECTDIVDLDGTELRRWIAVCGPQHALCDVRALGGTLRAGYRRPGERMRPLRLHGSKKLQDLFVDRHIPRSQRDSMVVVENEEHIVWVPGLALDERVAVGPGTRHVVHLRFRPKS